MTQPTETDLSIQMRARADADKLPPDHDMRRLADEFDAATAGYIQSTPQTVTVKGFLGAWARARKCWCSYTGEALVV